jgi:hypothetical protein
MGISSTISHWVINHGGPLGNRQTKSMLLNGKTDRTEWWMFQQTMTVLYWDVLGLAAYTPEMAMLGKLENHGTRLRVAYVQKVAPIKNWGMFM